MIEEYLQKLQQTLLANHYDDVENAIDYIMECIEDKKADFYDNIVRCDADHDGSDGCPLGKCKCRCGGCHQ